MGYVDEKVKPSKIYIMLLDIIRIVNVLNICLAIGVMLSNYGLNRYINIILILTACIVLSDFSQRILIRKFGTNDLLANSSIFRMIVFIINASIIIYFVLIKDYIIVFIMIIFYLGFVILLKYSANQRKRKEKLILDI